MLFFGQLFCERRLRKQLKLFTGLIMFSLPLAAQQESDHNSDHQPNHHSHHHHHATDSSDAKQQTLKQIMQGLLKQTEQITQGIFLENFQQIEQSASKIAHHPAPAAGEMQTIAAQLGIHMAQFKNYDLQVHQSAVTITGAAKSHDLKTVVSEYHQMIDGCLACHAQFKVPVAEALKAPMSEELKAPVAEKFK